VLRHKLFVICSMVLVAVMLSGCFGATGGGASAPPKESAGQADPGGVAGNPEAGSPSGEEGGSDAANQPGEEGGTDAADPPGKGASGGAEAPGEGVSGGVEAPGEGAATGPEAPGSKPDPVMEQLRKLTLDEKIGQLVLVGMDGTEPNEQTKDLIQTYHVGGFIFFKPNIQNAQQAVELFNALKTLNAAHHSVPLFMSVDEEGGRVSRLPNSLVKLPAGAEIGKANDPNFARELGETLGEELKAFGLNVDFAPVLDVNSNPDNPVIGDRSFGSDAGAVSRLGVPLMKGLQTGGVISVVKHFPGHGDTSVDSHLGLPVVNHDLNRLRKMELVPFADAVREGTDMVMVAHILLPKLDPDHPASFSKRAITDLLRGELGYDGVVITDDMTMGAVINHYDIGQASVEAIKAGGSIVLVGHEYDKQTKVLQALKAAAASGELSQEEIDDRVYGILALKRKYKLTDEEASKVDVERLNRSVNEVLERYMPQQAAG